MASAPDQIGKTTSVAPSTQSHGGGRSLDARRNHQRPSQPSPTILVAAPENPGCQTHLSCGRLRSPRYRPLLGILIIMSPAKPCTRAHCLYPSTTVISFLGTASVRALNLGIRICMESRRRPFLLPLRHPRIFANLSIRHAISP
ncbi:hypothetical protein IQ07DRAFT_186271 [Pyrenochaeta sp. DS3sAY3a]|nr:hypothetical protein IQ07DRAFT_186271 [Pyrenochaeta sp. DS3sAY3a]